MKYLKHSKRKTILLLLSVFTFTGANATYIFIPMDESQTQCLKAYGIAYMALKYGVTVQWLLNYRGASFAFPDAAAFEDACKIRNVKYELMADEQEASLLQEINNPEANMNAVKPYPLVPPFTSAGKQEWAF